MISLAAVYLVWGSTYLALRRVVDEMPPLLSGGLRYLVAGLLVLGFLALRGAPLPDRRTWVLSVPIGSLMFLGGNGFVAMAERAVPSGVAALVCATMPLLVAALGLGFGEPTSRREWAGMALGFAGVTALGASELRAAPKEGILLALAPLSWALGTVIARRARLPAGLATPATQLATGGLVMLAAGALSGERWTAGASAGAWAAWAYLVVFGSIVGFSAYAHLVRHASAALATSYAFVNPMLALALGVLLGGERATGSALGAGALVVAGVALVVRGKARPAVAPAVTRR